MKKTDILSLEPGSEMNALVAEKVMDYSGSAVADYADPVLRRCRYDFSLRMDDCWHVVEKIRQEYGHQFTLFSDWCFRKPPVWVAKFSPVRGATFHAEGHTAAVAICRAALLVVIEKGK